MSTGIFEKAVCAYLNGSLETNYAGLVHINPHPFGNSVILKYSQKCHFTHSWDDITRVCRGLILDSETGQILALPFSKFFNIGEQEETKLENLPSCPFNVYEKVDGTLGIFYWGPDGLPALASSGSFTSEQAKRGTEMLRQLPSINEVPRNLTFLFEIVYYECENLIIKYDFEGLVLLAIFDRVTGEELTWEEVKKWAQRLGVRTPKVYQFTSIKEVLDIKAGLPPDLEGFVIHFDNGLRVKLKGDTYLECYFERYKAAISLSRKKVFAAMVEGCLEELFQGLPEELPEELRLNAERDVEEINVAVTNFKTKAESFFNQAPKNDGRKNFALWVQANVPGELKGVLFQLLDGYQVNWFIMARKASQIPSL